MLQELSSVLENALRKLGDGFPGGELRGGDMSCGYWFMLVPVKPLTVSNYTPILKKQIATFRDPFPLPPGAGPHVRLWINSETETRD